MSRDGERARLREGARALGVELSQRDEEQLLLYADLLRRWATRMNLVADGDLPVLVERHFLDALAAVPVLAAEVGRAPRIADLGSGAGLPGVPLAIALRDARVTLVESRRRRVSFLRTVARELDLPVVVAHGDAFTFCTAHPEGFEAAVSRAAFSTDELLTLSRACLVRGGLAVAFKGADGAEPPSAETGPLRSAFAPPQVLRYSLPSRSKPCTLFFWRRRST